MTLTESPRFSRHHSRNTETSCFSSSDKVSFAFLYHIVHQKTTCAGRDDTRFSKTVQTSLTTSSYTTDDELTGPKLPSCSDLPLGWNRTHDRFIAYLATHAPLNRSGHIQRNEELLERYTLREMTILLRRHFVMFKDQVSFNLGPAEDLPLPVLTLPSSDWYLGRSFPPLPFKADDLCLAYLAVGYRYPPCLPGTP